MINWSQLDNMVAARTLISGAESISKTVISRTPLKNKRVRLLISTATYDNFRSRFWKIWSGMLLKSSSEILKMIIASIFKKCTQIFISNTLKIRMLNAEMIKKIARNMLIYHLNKSKKNKKRSRIKKSSKASRTSSSK